MSALDKQVGGSHYRQGGIQPIQYIEANNLQFLEGSVVKRVTRHDKKGGKGLQDIEKAIHELLLLLELRYPAQAKLDIGATAGADDWIEWDGDHCPVPQRVALHVRHRDGSTEVGSSNGFRWGHRGWPGDIVAYRVLPIIEGNK